MNEKVGRKSAVHRTDGMITVDYDTHMYSHKEMKLAKFFKSLDCTKCN